MKKSLLLFAVMVAAIILGLIFHRQPETKVSNGLPLGSKVWHDGIEYQIMTVGEAHGEKK